MAAVTVTYNTPLTTNSVGMLTTSAGAAAADISNAQLLAGCSTSTSSLLRTFLTGTYATDALAETAFRNLLGDIEVRQISGNVSTTNMLVQWIVSGVVIDLRITGTGNTTSIYEVIVRVAHSLIR